MKKMLPPIVILLVLLVLLGLSVFAKSHFPVTNKSEKPTLITPSPITKKTPMKISSTAFADQQSIPEKYTCKGDNFNPPLQFSDVPQNTKSLVLIMDDPDAPVGTFVHWVVYNLSPKVTQIPEKTDEIGNQGTNGFGKEAYGGPCPPSGIHHYHFKLYALDTILEFSQVPDKKAVEEKMQGHIIEQAELVGLFGNE